MNLSLSKLTMACLMVVVIAAANFAPPSALAAEQSEFAGVWHGKLSSLPFKLEIWERYSQWNATISFQGQPENLEVLGWKANTETFYFFRPADVACISMFIENNEMILAYFERDNIRKMILKRRP